jgi:SAM-dependent methyltransferase
MKQLLEPVLALLRGRHNSIRHRFFTLPREEIKYAWYRMTGRSWLDFYKSRLNAMVDTGREVSQRYLETGKQHAQYLIDHGLKPEHRLLDYGCGVLRLAHALLPYLPKGHYVGVDIAGERLEKGRALLAKRGIADDAYRVLVVQDCKLKELQGEKFDFVWAQSVFTHMPLEDIEEMLTSLKPLLNPGAQFYWTFSQAEKFARRNTKDFYYPEATLRATCERVGYRFEVMPDWDPVGGVMVRVDLA